MYMRNIGRGYLQMYNVYMCSYIQFAVHSSMLIVRVGLIQLAS